MRVLTAVTAAVATALTMCCAAETTSVVGVQARLAVEALENRVHAICDISVEYTESGFTRRQQQSTCTPLNSHVVAMRDVSTSSGWAVFVSSDSSGVSAMHDCYLGGSALVQPMRLGRDGWETAGTAFPLDSAQFLDQCVSFFHHIGIPRETSGPIVMLRVQVDGRIETLPFVSVRAAGSSATVCLSEPGLASYRAGNEEHLVEETCDEFRRVPPLGLVPVRKRVRNSTPGVQESETVVELKSFSVNRGSAAAAADTPTTVALLARYRGKSE